MQASEHMMPLKTAKNDAFSLKKVALKLLLVSFWAWMNLIFHARQFFINSEHILVILRPKNWNWIFTQFQLLFHRQADFWTLQRPPESDSWGFHGGIPSSGTQGSPPNHFRKKMISGLKSLTPSPSPLCSVQFDINFVIIISICPGRIRRGPEILLQRTHLDSQIRHEKLYWTYIIDDGPVNDGPDKGWTSRNINK